MILQPEGNSNVTSKVFGSCGAQELRSARSKRDALITEPETAPRNARAVSDSALFRALYRPYQGSACRCSAAPASSPLAMTSPAVGNLPIASAACDPYGTMVHVADSGIRTDGLN
jgi:hypothetical protein